MDKMTEYLRLDELRRKLMYVGYDDLGLSYLMPLQNEIVGRLKKLQGERDCREGKPRNGQ